MNNECRNEYLCLESLTLYLTIIFVTSHCIMKYLLLWENKFTHVGKRQPKAQLNTRLTNIIINKKRGFLEGLNLSMEKKSPHTTEVWGMTGPCWYAAIEGMTNLIMPRPSEPVDYW